jgi:O-antigen/teichoic acid export membrane protein
MLASGLLSRLGNAEIGAAGGKLTFLVAAGVMLWGVSVMQSQIFYGARRTWVVGVVTVAGAILNLLLNFLLVPVWGVNAAALSTLVCYVLTCFALYSFSRSIARVNFYWPHILKCLAAAFVMGAALRALNLFLPDALVITLLFAGLVYAFALWLLRAVAPSEVEFIRGFFRLPATVGD